MADNRIIFQICMVISIFPAAHNLTSKPSVSDFGTRGPGSIPRLAPIIPHSLFLLFSVIMLCYFIQVICDIYMTKNHSLTFYIELSSKICGGWVKFGPPER